jgi:biopolymer transport protein ExbD
VKFIKERPQPEIPTASMADIAFLLIVFFMLTTVFSVTKGLDFSLPKEEEEEAEEKPEEAVQIKIEADDSLTVDNKAMMLDDILAYIQPKLERNPNKPVIIQTDPEAHYDAMIGVFDEIRQAPQKIGMEVRNIAIPTRRDLEMIEALVQ